VKFSFDRYRGTSARALKEQVAAVEVVDAQRIRFRLKRPWPDFLTFYSSTTGAGLDRAQEIRGNRSARRASRRRRSAPAPYRFVSFTPGVELVFEAFEGYWRKTPSVKRLVFRVIPDETTRLAALKRGRGRHRLLDPRRTGRGAEAGRPALFPQGGGAAGHVLALLRRSVGRKITVA